MTLLINDKCNGCTLCSKICPTLAVSGEKKTKHEIDESLCIECLACGRLCPVGAIEDELGLVIEKVKKSELPKPSFIQKNCMACVICADVCPTGAIFLGKTKGKDKNLYPELNEKKCIGCGFCETECPVEAIEMS